jgi:hypothetical protein
MAITVQGNSQFTTQFPSATFTDVKFSKLRDVFKGPQGSFTPVGIITSTGVSISARELLRNTNVTPAAGEYQTDPIMPDATENAAVSTGADWKVSQIKNTIKFYVIDQTVSTDNDRANFNSSSVNWNGNLNKSIRKFITISGRCYSTTSATPAIDFTEGAYNLNVYMNPDSRVYGSGGTAGTASVKNGGYGGDAIRVISSTGKVRVYLYSSTNVYGGGGGGAKGATGDTGPTGLCPRRETYQSGCNCGGCPGCAGGWNRFGCPSCGGCNCGKGGCSATQYAAQCERIVFDTTQGYPGGEGGNGAAGRGWNNFSGTLIGSNGATAPSSGCSTYGPSPGSDGVTGEKGGDSGDWAQAGSSTDTNGGAQWQGNGGTGGAAGRAVTGSNYQVEGTLNSTTIKGLFNP